MAVTAIDLQVDDVSAAVELLSNAYGWKVTAAEPGFGEPVAGDVRIMLSVDAMVPWLTTDWGTEAAYLRGPGNLVVDVCRDAHPTDS